MKPLEFDGVKEPIVAIRWLYNMEGCFFTFSCSEEKKVRCTLNFICLGRRTSGNW